MCLVCVCHAPSLASSMIGFRLTNQGNRAIGRIDLAVTPPGAVVPPDTNSTQSPLTLLSTSQGFDQSLFTVALGSNTDEQILRLLFGQTQTTDAAGNVTFNAITGPNGQPIGLFEPGAILDFSLSIDRQYLSSMRLQLPEAADGLVLQTWPLGDVTTPLPGGGPPDGGGPTRPDTSQVPEPLSCLVWGGVVAGMITWRRRRARA